MFACWSLALGGLILMGMGVYFALFRPPLLPEDPRYIGASLERIRSVVPGLLPWLTRLFGVLGGFMFAAGLLTTYLAATSFRAGSGRAAGIALVSGAASIGVMTVTNFVIDSDFKWLLLSFLLPWVLSLALFWRAGKGSLAGAASEE